VIPALAIDLILQRKPEKRGGWLDVLAIGAAFLVLFFIVHWPFADFQISPAARNWFFAGDTFWAYFSHPGSYHSEFWRLQEDPTTPRRLGIALLWAIASTRVGLWWGDWMARVRR
jgi:hypothetical protein